MVQVRFSWDARADLKEIARYIARDKPDAARNWVVKIKAKCDLLASHPDLGEERPDLGDNVRYTLVDSYVIFYRRSSNAVEISRVVRGDREVRRL